MALILRGKRDFGLLDTESEFSKQWLMIFDELKTSGVKDVLLTCCDNLKVIS